MQTETTKNIDGALSALVGDWAMVASVDGKPVAEARICYDWIEGGAFLRQTGRAEPPLPNTPTAWLANSPFPTVAVIGHDDGSGTYTYLHADARGLRRRYAMTLGSGTWSLTGMTENGYHQRFTAGLDPAGNKITARWDSSQDGETWHHDFDETYTRIV
jgi:hypothetical protein